MLEELKDILKKIGGRFIIVEDGKPRYVILDFQEFKTLVGDFSENNPPKSQGLEKANEKLSGLKEEKDDLTVEDIPL